PPAGPVCGARTRGRMWTWDGRFGSPARGPRAKPSGSVDPSTLATGRIRTPVSGGLACGQLVLGACPETAVHGSGGTVSASIRRRLAPRPEPTARQPLHKTSD